MKSIGQGSIVQYLIVYFLWRYFYLFLYSGGAWFWGRVRFDLIALKKKKALQLIMVLLFHVARTGCQHLLISLVYESTRGHYVFSWYPCIRLSQYVLVGQCIQNNINWKRGNPPHLLMCLEGKKEKRQLPLVSGWGDRESPVGKGCR